MHIVQLIQFTDLIIFVLVVSGGWYRRKEALKLRELAECFLLSWRRLGLSCFCFAGPVASGVDGSFLATWMSMNIFVFCDKRPECSWLTFEKLKWNLPTEFCGLVLFFLVRWIGVDLFCFELSVATVLLTYLYNSQALSRNSSVFRPIFNWADAWRIFVDEYEVSFLWMRWISVLKRNRE